MSRLLRPATPRQRPWNGSTIRSLPKITGALVRVDCVGKQFRLSVKDDAGKTVVLAVPDPQQFEIKDGATLTCGTQKPRRVTVSYKPGGAVAQTRRPNSTCESRTQ